MQSENSVEFWEMGGDDEVGLGVSTERGEASGVVFARAAPLVSKNAQESSVHECGISHSHGCAGNSAADLIQESDPDMRDGRLDRRGLIDLGYSFRVALFSRDWEIAGRVVAVADPPMLNYLLSVSLDSIWFLRTQQDLCGVTGLMREIVAGGASDFTRVILRSSLLASCVAACQSKMLALGDSMEIIAQRLHERLQECHGDDSLKAEAAAKVEKFMEWALKCVRLHRSRENEYRGHRCTLLEVQLHLSAFRVFLDLAGDNLSGKVFTEAFDAACFPLTLFSSLFEPGWSFGTSAVAIHGLLEMLVEGGADNVNQCFLEASRFGSTELVRILLQIARQNNLALDIDLALVFASHHCKFGTMECLVDEGNAISFLGPLIRASERGCIQVVEWFVNRGCPVIELCLALTVAASNSQFGTATYLLPHIPQHVLAALGTEILKAARERNSGSLDGVTFLLRSNFLSDADATYAVADSIARSNDNGIPPELRAFLKEHWSWSAFADGMNSGKLHFVNMMRVLKRGTSPICLRDLPLPLVIAIAYLPLYRECVKAGGQLLPQRLRGELVVAVNQLGQPAGSDSKGNELLLVLEHHLPSFVIESSSCALAM